MEPPWNLAEEHENMSKNKKLYAVTMEDLIAAYRVAKRHLYGQTSRPRLFKILNFEQNLVRNLRSLQSQLTSGDVDGLVNGCEGFCVVPSRLEGRERRNKNFTLISSDREVGDGVLSKGKLYFRTFSDLPVESEIVFALWMMKAGCKIDEELPSSAFGGRFSGSRGKDVFGSRDLYPSMGVDYVAWQKNLSGRIHQMLHEGLSVCVFLSEFRDNVVFSSFKSFDAEVSGLVDDGCESLTELISRMLAHWRRTYTQLTSGIPLGSVLERLLTNVHLRRLDREFEKVLHPKFYSRCGSSFAVVLPLEKGFSESKQFCTVEQVVQNGLGIRNPKANCPDGVLKRTRTRILKFSPRSGADFMDAIDSAVAEDDREWGMLPELPDSTDEIKRMHTPFGKQGGECDLLSLSQTVLSRRKFVKRIRCMETFSQYLHLKDWEMQRIDFLETVRDSFLDAQSFLEYYTLYPRVLAVAFAAAKSEKTHEFKLAMEMLGRIDKYIDALAKNFSVEGRRRKLSRKEIDAYHESLRRSFAQSVLECMSAVVMRDGSSGRIQESLCRRFPSLFGGIGSVPRYKDLMHADLTMIPFKAYVVKMLANGLRQDVATASAFPKELLPDLSKGVKSLLSRVWASAAEGKESASGFPSAFYFATRALDITDVYALLGLPGREVLKEFGDALKELCGVRTEDGLPCAPTERAPYVVVRDGRKHSVAKIALASWLVDMPSWTAMVTGDVDDRRCDRFVRLMKLTNRILSLEDRLRPHYLVFPELAMPVEWFLLIARKLAAHGISTISGVDYIHRPTDETGRIVLEDQVWCALCNSYSSGACPVIVKYSKSHAAIHEERELLDIANARFADNGVEQKQRYLISHGDNHDNVCFSTLICSDLLDIQSRADFRGKVDILFVPAWNKDVETYSSLVEAAAYDIHAYVVLCNSREFGDTRLRSPARNDYDRDVVRIRGGLQDFFVVGEVDVEGLRRFQSRYHSPDRPFKPTPTAFKVANYRKRMPSTGS